MITTKDAKNAKFAKGVKSLFPIFVLFVVQVFASIDLLAQDRAAELVQQLRDLPRPVASTGNSATLKAIEARRQQLYTEIARLGESGARALVEALRDTDPTMRQNVATALVFLSMNLYREQTRLDLTAQVPGLRAALRDPDDSVRSWVAQAIGPIGQAAAPALPELLVLLQSTEGSRNSALIALAGIGPAASEALPAVRAALEDSSLDVRRFAHNAIDKIDGANRDSVTIKGRLRGGERWGRPFGPGFELEFLPEPSGGWRIRVDSRNMVDLLPGDFSRLPPRQHFVFTYGPEGVPLGFGLGYLIVHQYPLTGAPGDAARRFESIDFELRLSWPRAPSR